MPKTTNDHKTALAALIYAKSGGTVTNFQPNSVNAAVFGAVGQTVSEIDYGLEKAVLNSRLATAKGDYLNEIGETEYGIQRLGPRKGGVILWFYGSDGSTIPAGTEISNSVGDIVYKTINEAAITGSDHGRVRVEAISDKAGGAYRAAPYQLNKFVAGAPAGITSVENRAASVGTSNQETDAEYRVRCLGRLALLEQETAAWHVAVAQDWEPNIVRAFPTHDGSNVTISLALRNGTAISDGDLTALEDYYHARFKVNPNRTVTCRNIQWTDIAIEAKCQLKTGYTLTDVVRSYADRLDSVLSILVTIPGKTVDQARLIAELINTGMVENLVESEFMPVRDVSVASNTLPRVASINITDEAGNSLSEDHRTYISI